MFDDASPSDTQALQRAVGELRVTVKRFGPETVLDELRQVGCLKARFPRRVTPGWMDIVMLNTGGGVAGGDQLTLAFAIGTGAHATIAAQAAERFYRARTSDKPSHVRTTVSIAPDAAVEWLPQETILFDNASLDRQLHVDMAANASFLGIETLVFGRTAMGERVHHARLRDLIRIHRDGELLLHDAIRLEGEVDATLSRPAIAKGAKVVATMIHVAPDAEAKLAAIREALPTTEAGVSAWNGMLVVRILGPDSATVRRSAVSALAVLRQARPLPRVWLC